MWWSLSAAGRPGAYVPMSGNPGARPSSLVCKGHVGRPQRRFRLPGMLRCTAASRVPQTLDLSDYGCLMRRMNHHGGSLLRAGQRETA